MRELIGKLEAATGPDRDIDYRIEKALVRPEEFPNIEMWPPFAVGSKFEKSIPSYTASLDAAVALVGRALNIYSLMISIDPSGNGATINRWPDGLSAGLELGPFTAVSVTPELAVLTATLRALADREGGE